MRSCTWRRVVALGLMVALVSSCTADSVGTSPDNPHSNGPVGTSPDNPHSNGPTGALLVKSDKPQDITPAASDADVQALGTGNRAFAFDLYSELAQAQGNLFFSPYSISVALAMTYAGARGHTASEMQHALHFGADQTTLHAAFNATGRALVARQSQLPETSSGNGFELNIVNQAWGDKQASVRPDYLDVLAQNYGAGMYVVDFMHDPDGSRLLINDWVASQTQDRITDLLPQGSINSNTALVLTNAIYFKASWLFKFNPAMTQSAVFHAPAGDRSVPMMHQFLRTRYTETADYQAVELPYLSQSVRMLIVLPAPGRFDAVAQRLGGTFDQVRRQLADYHVTLAMPKFSFDAAPKLKSALQALGMREAFTTNADFSGLDGTQDLMIDDVVHKAFVAVDEAGTEATAATAGLFTVVSLPPSAQLTLDRPFLFLVFDEPTGAVLFLGRLSDPS